MSLSALLQRFMTFLHSDAFAQKARHPDHPNGFSRQRKLPLTSLVACMLRSMSKRVQVELDQFFASCQHQPGLSHCVSEQAFAQARTKLSHSAFTALNDHLLALLESHSLIPRWRGLRLVAADASHLNLAVRACHRSRAARPQQLAFGLYLVEAEMMLAATLYSPQVGERQMLFEHLDRLRADDLLLLDRGYPCRWLVAALNQRGIPFCMRVDALGYRCVREFMSSGLKDQDVMLPAPSQQDAASYECLPTPQPVRLVKYRTPKGKVHVVMTNLMDRQRFPASVFMSLYHQRWRIEEAFKRLKHRLQIEQVSGLSQRAVMQDFAAKIVCDNLERVVVMFAERQHRVGVDQATNRAYGHMALRDILPVVLTGCVKAMQRLAEATKQIARCTFPRRPGTSKPRPKDRGKPRKHLIQKTC
ncbi:IS4 family transposase [Pokkaliibacter sp. MBI-7]|uniref:IS4 family transposase n=1 Tax=Pokkaliibacter sp. MBI-7 TaxID=3040600 RepID=UPI002447C9AB|nr:IS4 family transposase [Pokkaliibacter sp. MBI-7]MDH2431785.1 IS4 family transposase [Pokkaliibacter sp. MBI-7]MDH2434373.1 IS4 family transposase [Pokkaliibacter sp. MBI-7]MDH2434416.1 IS4 family transposase [Pokkaliibacter sp. MBI-7]MDH2436217.1 IS4 family transposase [Pokkaliibacter sp. MBI-7]